MTDIFASKSSHAAATKSEVALRVRARVRGRVRVRLLESGLQ